MHCISLCVCVCVCPLTDGSDDDSLHERFVVVGQPFQQTLWGQRMGHAHTSRDRWFCAYSLQTTLKASQAKLLCMTISGGNFSEPKRRYTWGKRNCRLVEWNRLASSQSMVYLIPVDFYFVSSLQDPKEKVRFNICRNLNIGIVIVSIPLLFVKVSIFHYDWEGLPLSKFRAKGAPRGAYGIPMT